MSGSEEYRMRSLAVEGRDYAVYMADGREVTESDAGGSIQSELSLRLPEGNYRVRLYSPASGEYFHSTDSKGGVLKVAVGPFEHDLVLRAAAG